MATPLIAIRTPAVLRARQRLDAEQRAATMVIIGSVESASVPRATVV